MRPFDETKLDLILKYVNRYYQENHASPTISEIAEGTGVARSTTQRYLLQLKERGMLDYGRGILNAPESAKMKTGYVSAPLLGSIRCGSPEEEEEAVEEYISLPVSMFGKGDFYVLRASGDSMVDAGIEENNLVVIEKGCYPCIGDIVVALDDEFQNTLKRFAGVNEDGFAVLEYMNKAVYPGKQILVKHLSVQGIARHVVKSLSISAGK